MEEFNPKNHSPGWSNGATIDQVNRSLTEGLDFGNDSESTSLECFHKPILSASDVLSGGFAHPAVCQALTTST
jgi:hypothetical protein